MNIETAIKDVITQKLSEGIVERLVAENLEKCINKALENLTGPFGDITKVIEEKIKGVMIGQLSSYDYSKYIVKLDCVLTEILKKTSLDHARILGNFKELMVEHNFPEVVKLSDIFEEFKKFVTKNVDTGKLEVDHDDGVSYEHVSVTMEFEKEEKRSWSTSSFEYAKVIFECEKDEGLNFEVRLSKFMNYGWELSTEIDTSIKSLRYLDDMKIYLLKLKQSSAKIEIDEEDMSDEVRPEKEPEASFE